MKKCISDHIQICYEKTIYSGKNIFILFYGLDADNGLALGSKGKDKIMVVAIISDRHVNITSKNYTRYQIMIAIFINKN